MPVVVRGLVSVALAAALGLTALSADSPAQAQESAATYPSRPITFLVGFAAGGPTDVIAAQWPRRWRTSSAGRS